MSGNNAEAEQLKADLRKARAFESAYRSALKIVTESLMPLAAAHYPTPEGEADPTQAVIKDLSDSLLSVIMQRDNAQALADQRGARLTALEEDHRTLIAEVERLTGLVRQRFGEVPT